MDPTLASELHYRIAAADDIPSLVAMINAAFSIEEFLEGTRTDPERLANVMTNGEMLVAEDAAGRLVGTLFMENRGERGYLGMLAVDPAAQRRGIARRMTTEAERRLRAAGCKVVEIIVLNMRPELVPLYCSWGFQEAGTTEFKPSRAVKQGVQIHGIRMEKSL
jgi:ribosomal protein S18 acetylase RimI-like enzyme